MKKLLILLMLIFVYGASAGTCPNSQPICPEILGDINLTGDLTVTGDIACTDISCSGGLLLNDATADGSGDLIVDDDSGNELLKADVSAEAVEIANGTLVIDSTGSRVPTPTNGQGLQQFDFLQADVSVAAPCVITEASNGLVNGDAVELATNGTLPSPFTVATVTGDWYYIVEKATNTFQLAATRGGTGIECTDNGDGGTHTLREQIEADQCGGIKRLSSTLAVTTAMFSSITKPVTATTAGCIMYLVNDNGADVITIDGNGRFNAGNDYVLGTQDTVIIGSGLTNGSWSVYGGFDNP